MDKTIVLITGANTGLGLETVGSLLRSSTPYTILLGGRSRDKAHAAVQLLQAEFPNTATVVTPVQVDIEDDDSIENAFNYVADQYGRVDVLINNAGMSLEIVFNVGVIHHREISCSHEYILGGQFDPQMYSGELTMRDMWNKSWNVNTTGTHILTHTFVPLLVKFADPRLLFITSGTSTLTESDNLAIRLNQSPAKGWPKTAPSISAYRSSKTGMNMLMREWRRILSEDGVKTWCVSPGFLATGLGGNAERNRQLGAIDPAIGANFVRDVVEGARDQDVGKAIRWDGVQPW
jgi:NAD(P)-dependent dehydrogenase (short-subunit alcohol dehydrogenase family)